MKRVYVAGRYNGDSAADMLGNIGTGILTCKTLIAQGVAPLVFSSLIKCPGAGSIIPQAIFEAFQKTDTQNHEFKQEAATAESDILNYLDARSISVMPLTSMALDLLIYKNRTATFAHDADLVLGVRRDDLSDSEVQEITAFFTGVSNRFKYFTNQFPRDYEYYEYDYFQHHDLTINGMLPVDFSEIWKRSREFELNGHKIQVMDTEDLLISLCISSARKRFFRLKNMVDIHETISQANAPGRGTFSIDWDEFLNRASKYRCTNIVYAALQGVKEYFQTDIPDSVLRNLPSSRLRASIMNSIVNRRFFPELKNYSELYTSSGIIGTTINQSLLLPYSTYNFQQWLHKTKYVLSNNLNKMMKG